MRIEKETYRGYDIIWDTTLRIYCIKNGNDTATQMHFVTIKGAKNVIDSHCRFNGEPAPVAAKPKVIPPISEQKLREVISRPKAEYSNKNHNQ